MAAGDLVTYQSPIGTDVFALDTSGNLTIAGVLTSASGDALAEIILPVVTDKTIASGVVTLTGPTHTVRGEGAASDNCDTISGMTAFEVVFLVTGAEAITYRDFSVGAGNIATTGNASIVTATGDMVAAYLTGTVVHVAPVSVASASAYRTLLGLAIGTDVQAYDASLLSLAALATAADKFPYTTAADTYAEATLTAAGRALLDDAAASNQRTTLGLVIGTDVQAYDASLLSLATLATAADKIAYTTGVDTWAETAITAAGRAILDDASAAAQATTLGLGTGDTPSFTDVKVTADAAANGTGVVLTSETLQTRTALLTLTNVDVVLADNAGVVAYGSLKVLDLPEGTILFLGASMDLALTKSSAGVNTDWDGDIGLGTVAANNGATLATTEQDLIPTTATPQAVAGVTTGDGESTSTEACKVFDGSTTPIDVYLNILVDDADHDVTGTACNIIVNGTIKVTYVNLGDN